MKVILLTPKSIFFLITSAWFFIVLILKTTVLNDFMNAKWNISIWYLFITLKMSSLFIQLLSIFRNWWNHTTFVYLSPLFSAHRIRGLFFQTIDGYFIYPSLHNECTSFDYVNIHLCTQFDFIFSECTYGQLYYSPCSLFVYLRLLLLLWLVCFSVCWYM